MCPCLHCINMRVCNFSAGVQLSLCDCWLHWKFYLYIKVGLILIFQFWLAFVYLCMFGSAYSLKVRKEENPSTLWSYYIQIITLLLSDSSEGKNIVEGATHNHSSSPPPETSPSPEPATSPPPTTLPSPATSPSCHHNCGL